MAVFSKNQRRTERETNNNIDNVEYQSQVNLNDRLDYMRFKNYTRAEFDNTAPHDDTDISFVTNTDNSISLYKGDTLLSGEGSGFIIKHAARIGTGTGIGGEPYGNNEINNICNSTGVRGSRNTIDNNSNLGKFTNQHVHYWLTGTVGTSTSFNRNGANRTVTFKGRTEFRTNTANNNRWVPIICNKRKVFLRPGIRSVADGASICGSSTSEPSVSALAFSPRGHVYLWRNGARELLEWELFVSQVYFRWNGQYDGSGLKLRESSGMYNADYKIRITHSGDGFSKSRFLSKTFTPTYTRRTLGEDDYILTSGILFGFDRVEKNNANLLYGQLREPCLLWGVNHIKESSSEPYGLFFDISTGDPLTEPFVEFANTRERDYAYICGLGDDINI